MNTDKNNRKLELLKEIKSLAKEYRILTDRPLGVTGEIAEYEAIRLLNLEICCARQEGYDAIRKTADKDYKIQIKGRVAPELKGQIGSIKCSTEWDTVVFVALNNDLEPIKIYEATREVIEPILKAPNSKARNERGQMSIRKFKSVATLIWPLENAN